MPWASQKGSRFDEDVFAAAAFAIAFVAPQDRKKVMAWGEVYPPNSRLVLSWESAVA